MYRTLCVLALLTLQDGLAHFPWDIVGGMEDQLHFYSYNEGKLMYSQTSINYNIHQIIHDPIHNRILFNEKPNAQYVLSLDMTTGEIQTLIDFKEMYGYRHFAYDPASDLFFATTRDSELYSYFIKPGSNNEVIANFVVNFNKEIQDLAVDSCQGYIYWTREDTFEIERVRFNGSEYEPLLPRDINTAQRKGLTIDPKSNKMYWIEYGFNGIIYIARADMDGTNKTVLYVKELTEWKLTLIPTQLAVSKDFIYWRSEYELLFWQLPKDITNESDATPKQIAINASPSYLPDSYIVGNYAIEEKTQGMPLCTALKRLLPNYIETKDNASLNVSTDESLLRTNTTNVTWDVPVCHNYCLQGNCGVSAEGQPKCSCNAGYSGDRCEVKACQAYCLNDGVCSLSEQNNPECRCKGGYQGERCDVPDFLIKCSQTVSMLKDILNADIVIFSGNRLEFYNEGRLMRTAYPTPNVIAWITYDPFHDRVLFTETAAPALRPVFSFDIATEKNQTLIHLKEFSWRLVYDPPREVLFSQGKKSIQSFLVKPGSDVESKGTHLVNLKALTNNLIVDSCRGNMYWITIGKCTIEKVRFDGTDSKVIDDGCKDSAKTGLAIDPQAQKLYWAEKQENITYFFSADLDGNNKRSFYNEEGIEAPNQMTVTKDFIYWLDVTKKVFWQLPKDIPFGTDVEPKHFALYDQSTDLIATGLASNYPLEGQSLGNPDCKALKSLVPNNSTTPESRVSGDTRNVPVCHYYCFKGHCSTSADGQPKCRCNAGYSGHRCEVDLCQKYCLNKGDCSLDDKSQPICRCSSDYQGDRCETSVFLTKFVQQFIKKTESMLNKVLNKVGLSVTE